jgi:hypothetical protein
MRDIQASAEVEALIGAEMIQSLYADTIAIGHCWRCRQAVNTKEAATVIVENYRNAYVVKVAHARCASSQVVDVDADFPYKKSRHRRYERQNGRTGL